MSEQRRECAGGCRRTVGFTKASGRTLCWWCDPSVPAEVKAGARSDGGHSPRSGMKFLPAITEPFDFTEPQMRIDFRAWVAWMTGRGELSEGPAGVMLRAVDGAGEDQERFEIYPRMRKVMRAIEGRRR